ncbi:unnamed protein product [Musa hybrid cultivar]
MLLRESSSQSFCVMAHQSHYGEFSTGVDATMQGFDHHHELFGVQAGMETLGVPSKQQSSRLAGGFLPRDFPEASNKHRPSASPWPVDDPSLGSLFPWEGRVSVPFLNGRHSDAVAVPQPPQQCVPGDRLQIGSAYLQQQQQLFVQDGRVGFHPQQPLQLRNSKFLRPAQELLSEFCSLRGEISSKRRPNKTSLEDEEKASLSSSWNQSLHSMDLLELQKIKAKLSSMIAEVDKRYRKYCEQMRTVTASFEAVAGKEAARVYSALAHRAMSRHFRCLRDGIVGQIHAAKKAMGEKDPTAAGTTRGETPRLKLLDKCIRQQKAFQQGMMEQPPWRPQRGLPERAVSILRAWLFEHFLHPYPNDVDKHILARQTGLSRSQVSNWFINARVRLWKPMVEEMYLEETKELDDQSNQAANGPEDSDNPNSNLSFDQKPLPAQLLVDSESLSSIINSGHHGHQRNDLISSTHHQDFGVVGDLDFSYNSRSSDNSRAGVSLTLGLQQHNGGGMSFSLLPNSQPSLLFSRETIDGDQQAQFSILDGEAENLRYRNLMGAQLLHDLAR